MTIAELEYWQKYLKSGDLVKFTTRFTGPLTKIVRSSTDKYISFGNDQVTNRISWMDVIEVYTKEDNPEEFL